MDQTVSYYTNSWRKLGDFFLGVFGAGALIGLNILIGFVLFEYFTGNFRTYLQVIAIVASFVISGYASWRFIKSDRGYLASGIIVLLSPFLLAGGCSVVIMGGQLFQ